MTIAFNLTLGNVVANPTYNSHMTYAGSDTTSSVVVKYNNTRGAFVIGKIPDIMDVSQIDQKRPPFPELSVFEENGYFQADFEGSIVYSFNQPISDVDANGPYTAALEFDARFRIRDASQDPIYTFPGPRAPVTVLDSNKLNFIGTGEQLVGPNSQYWISLNSYGQLVGNNLAAWNDPSAVAGDSVLKLEASGALNLYNVYGDLMKTFFQDTSAVPSKNYFLSLTANGALLLKDVAGKTLWSLDITSNSNLDYKQIVSFDNGLCLDGSSKMVPCDKTKQSQMWNLDSNGLLHNQAGGCLTSKLTVGSCVSDYWSYQHNSLVFNNYCLTNSLQLANCDESQQAQEWNFNSKFGSPLTYYAINKSGLSKQFVVGNGKLSNGVACAGDDGVFSKSCYTVTSSWQYVNNVIKNKNMQCLTYDLLTVECDMIASNIMWTLIPEEVLTISNPVHIYSPSSQCIGVNWWLRSNNTDVGDASSLCQLSATGSTCQVPSKPPVTASCPFNTCIVPPTADNTIWNVNLKAVLKSCDQSTFWKLDGTKLRYIVNPAWCLARDLSLQVCSSINDAWTFNNGALNINNGTCLQSSMLTGPNCNPTWIMSNNLPLTIDSHTLYNYATGANMGKWFWVGNVLAFDDGKPFYPNPDNSIPVRQCAINAQLALGTQNCYTGFVNDYPNVEAPDARLVYTSTPPSIGSPAYAPLYLTMQPGVCLSAGLLSSSDCKDLFAFVNNRLFAQANPAYCLSMNPTAFTAVWVPCYKQNTQLSWNADKSIRPAGDSTHVLDSYGVIGRSAYFFTLPSGTAGLNRNQLYSFKLSDVTANLISMYLANIAQGKFLRTDLTWDTDSSQRWYMNPQNGNIISKDDLTRCLTRQGGSGSTVVYAPCGSIGEQNWQLDSTYNMICKPDNSVCFDNSGASRLLVFTRDIHNPNQMITYDSSRSVFPSNSGFAPVVYNGGNNKNDWLLFNGWDAQGAASTNHGQMFVLWNGQMHFNGNPAWCVSGVDNNDWTPTILKPCHQSIGNVRQDGSSIKFGDSYCLDLWNGVENGLAHLRTCQPGNAYQFWSI
ncbi:hypothetical protein BJ741DRAFT_603646 [Chytriomyces cf. hyalinus JEL632]|nr:hypothetical protein BJ741DRAFT_603646 [Chytriomyces cf. hyalinus JEL632]